jgi:hypothetical protein
MRAFLRTGILILVPSMLWAGVCNTRQRRRY